MKERMLFKNSVIVRVENASKAWIKERFFVHKIEISSPIEGNMLALFIVTYECAINLMTFDNLLVVAETHYNKVL